MVVMVEEVMGRRGIMVVGMVVAVVVVGMVVGIAVAVEISTQQQASQ